MQSIKRPWRAFAGVAVLLAAGCGESSGRTARNDSGGVTQRTSARDSAAHRDSLPAAKVPLVARPAQLRGLYVNRWAALGDRMWRLIDVAKTTEVNALVIDVKDDR